MGIFFLHFSADFNVQPGIHTPSLGIKKQDDFQFVLNSEFFSCVHENTNTFDIKKNNNNVLI